MPIYSKMVGGLFRSTRLKGLPTSAFNLLLNNRIEGLLSRDSIHPILMNDVFMRVCREAHQFSLYACRVGPPLDRYLLRNNNMPFLCTNPGHPPGTISSHPAPNGPTREHRGEMDAFDWMGERLDGRGHLCRWVIGHL